MNSQQTPATAIGDLTSKDARQFFQRRPTLTTLCRWLHHGVVNKSTGERVFLRFDQDGGQLRFKREYLTEFIDGLNKRVIR